jgi:hypothetical protein
LFGRSKWAKVKSKVLGCKTNLKVLPVGDFTRKPNFNFFEKGGGGRNQGDEFTFAWL